MRAFEPPPGWRRITTIDAHTAGEPLRLVTSGYPSLPGDTMLARRRFAREHHDALRTLLVGEPRGHRDMYACVPTPPATADGDLGVLFLHNEGYSTMCGHGIVAVATIGIECALWPVGLHDRAGAPVLRIDTPAGRVTARASVEAGRVRSVAFENVASFVLIDDLRVAVPGVGTVRCDVAYGGAFYAYVDAADVGLALRPEHARDLVDAGMRIKRAVAAAVELAHPDGDDELGFLYGTIFVGPGTGTHHSRNVCVFAEGELDRSPTGTGVSGRVAIEHARGRLRVGEPITIESILGTSFGVRAVRTARVGPHDAVVPEVTGSAFLTGRHEFWLDPRDPLGTGFFL